jgi:hypothetical protein
MIGLGLLISGAFVHAQDSAAEARQHFNEGSEALRDKRFREAALHYEAAGKLRPHPSAFFTAAMAWDKAEDPNRAADDFAKSLDLPGLNAKDTKTATDRLAVLERTLGTLVIKGPSELVVQLEGLTEANPPARLHGAPGIRVLLVDRGGKIERRDVKLKLGESTEIDVTEPLHAEVPTAAVSASAAPAPTTTAPQSELPPDSSHGDPAKTRKYIGYTAMGLGAVSAGVAIVFGFKTLSARDDYQSTPTHDSYDHATSMKTWTNVGWAGAAVLGGVGAALVFWPKSKDPHADSQSAAITVTTTPGGVQLQGAF